MDWILWLDKSISWFNEYGKGLLVGVDVGHIIKLYQTLSWEYQSVIAVLFLGAFALIIGSVAVLFGWLKSRFLIFVGLLELIALTKFIGTFLQNTNINDIALYFNNASTACIVLLLGSFSSFRGGVLFRKLRAYILRNLA